MPDAVSFFAAALAGAVFVSVPQNAEQVCGSVTSVEYSAESVIENPGQAPFIGVPPWTIVQAVLTPAEGSRIRIAVCLPSAEKWNGRFLGLGNGGGAGGINPYFFIGPLSQGYACATTDMGTAPDPQTSGVGNKEVWSDFGFRATHLMTVAAKGVVKAFYGKQPEFSYFSGSSTGGQQALQEAQRYPEDYDGIFANVPAHCRAPLHAYFLWNQQILQKCPFAAAEEAGVIEAARRVLADRQPASVRGKAIVDPRVSQEEIARIIALARKLVPSLTDRHAEALRKIFDGPRHEVTGERIFNGVPPGARFTSAVGHFYLFNWVFPGKPLDSIRFGRDIEKYCAGLGPYLNAENPDLRAFEKRGGKLLIVSGCADEVVPYTATLDYYERLIELYGNSPERVQAFCLFYMIPEMNHGGIPGGGTPFGIHTVAEWREKGVAPGMGRIFRGGDDPFELAVFPYPATASEYRGKDSIPGPDRRGGVERIAEKFLNP